MASSSSSPRVFASFHGPDVRTTFLSHLRKQFNYNGITMFNDEWMERGQAIGPTLIQAIREARISIVVLSENYATSTWCLDELVEIMKCREDMGQLVYPIFYGVDPSDVRKQTGDIWKGFWNTIRGRTEGKVTRWKQVLTDVASIAGEHSRNWASEADVIESIASRISNVLNDTPSRDFDELVGLDAHYMKMLSLLDFDYDGVKMVGICGPAGIGKTTIARFLHSQLACRFQLTCFVDNLRESYHSGFDEYGLKLRLQEQFLSNILNQNGMMIRHLGLIKERLIDQRVLVILDDVNNIKQLEALAGDNTWFGPGSRIIVTTENQDLLEQHGIKITYHMGFPSGEEALEILCRYAFGQSYPQDGFEVLSVRITELCGNLPFGLRVVGSSLSGKKKEEWEEVERRLETIIYQDIDDVLRVGYESLDETEQALFLQIAVFFNSKDVDLVKGMFSEDIEHGLKILVNRSLVYITTEGKIMIHELLQQLARQAIHRQEPWKRQILNDARDICDVLENDKSTRAVTGISFDISDVKDLSINERAFKKMPDLHFLSVYKSSEDGNDRVDMPEDLELPNRLRLLEWKAYPSKCLPPKFHPEYLVELNMPHSKLEYLWKGTQVLGNLMKMDLSCSRHLKELPDLSKATNLERLDLSLCFALVELPSSIRNLQKLRDLLMHLCKNLKVIPTQINLASLERIHMGGCLRLRTFPNISTNIFQLNVSDTAVEQLPASTRLLSRLSSIDVSSCGKLDSETFTHFPESLVSINLSYTDTVKIPDRIKGLNGLQRLDVTGCKKLASLPELPGSLTLLTADGCESLEKLTHPLHTPNAHLSFINCFKLDGKARKAVIQQSLLDGCVCLPGKVMPSEFNHRARGSSLTVGPISASSRFFKACVVISPNQQNQLITGGDHYLWYRIKGKVGSVIQSFAAVVAVPGFLTGIRTEHLCIFCGELPENVLSSEILFESRDSKLEDWKITECGVRILTDRSNDQVSEDDDDWSYKLEGREVLDDTAYSWSWLFPASCDLNTKAYKYRQLLYVFAVTCILYTVYSCYSFSSSF